MRRPRLKIPSSDAPAAYHCVSRIVNGERIINASAKEIFRRQLWQVAEFCGVQVVTYAILDNHFHVLVHVPQRAPISNAELLRRYCILYPRPTRYQSARLSVIISGLYHGAPEAVAWRQRQLSLMGDVSQYMKLLKQRFSIWFNQTHRRFGTLWAERFKSVLVEPRHHALQAVAAYIDLNAVRAGLVSDPKEYRFCGYAEATAGHPAARTGIGMVVGSSDWTAVHASYRQILFGTGARPRAGRKTIPVSALERVVREHGHLSVAAVLRCRWRHFTDGVVLGTQAFVARQVTRWQAGSGQRQKLATHELPEVADWGNLVTLRRPRSRAGPLAI